MRLVWSLKPGDTRCHACGREGVAQGLCGRHRHHTSARAAKIAGAMIGPRVRLPQAKDVPEDVILRVLRELPDRWHTQWLCHSATCDGAACWSLPCRAPELAVFPEKVLRAKLSAMMRRKLVDGCDCGCRGDWHIPELFYAG